MAKKYYWLKLGDDFFGNKSIKKLRKIAGGDTYTIIYLKMLLKAIKQDNKLFFEGVEDNFADELALDMNEDVENVRITVSYLQSQGLIQLVDDDEYLLTEGAKMTGQESESAERVRRFRERKTLQCNDDVTGALRLSNTEIEIEKEIEIEIEKENTIVSDDTIRRTEVQRVVNAWNQVGVNPVSRMIPSSNRYKMITARIREYGVEEVLKAISRINDSIFLKGGGNKGWTIDFEWFARPNNFPKVLEGRYDDSKDACHKNDLEDWSNE